ncbi:unnamed protein product [Cunninghamella blakesleeana]
MTKDNSNNNVFFYGTLMSTEIMILCGVSCPEVLRTAKIATLELNTATLKGYKRLAVKHAAYPGIIPSDNQNDQVEGILCQGLSLDDVSALDAYEDDEYERRVLDVTLKKNDEKITCQVYIWIAGNDQLEDFDWDYQDWEKRFLHITEF